MKLAGRLVLPIVVAFTASAAVAQAPKITSKGDPSVKDDTIYALALNPAPEGSNAPPLVLFEDVVIRLEADGRHTRTIRSVVQILREADVARFTNQQLSYDVQHEGLAINWMRVLKPTGELISDKPVHPAETDAPASIYSKERIHRIVSSGVAVGTIIDFSYTKEEKRPFRSNDHYYVWNLGSPLNDVKRTRFVYDVPSGVQPTITERDIAIKPVVAEAGGRRTYVWAAQDVPRFTPEPFAPDSLSRPPRVSVSLPMTWADIGKWYAAIGRGLYDLDGGGDARSKAAMRGARNLEDSIRLTHKWISQQIPPAPAAFGAGPYKIRPPIEILLIPASSTAIVGSPATDAKEKVQVFIGAMMKLKVEAFPVLASLTASAEPKNPSVQQFNTVIAAVKRPEGSYAFADLMSRSTKYGELPPAMQGGFALLIKPDGGVEELRLPRTSASSRKSETIINATLSDSGIMSGVISDIRAGDGWEQIRAQFGVTGSDPARLAVPMRQHLARFPGATGTAYSAFDGTDMAALMSYTTTFSGARVSAPANGGSMLTVPIPPLAVGGFLGMLQSRGARSHPIDANRMLFNANTTQELILTLPTGWRARRPADVTANSDFGRYSVTYAQSGNVLRIVRKMEPGDGVFPASRMADLIAWLTAIRADEGNRTILLEHPPR